MRANETPEKIYINCMHETLIDMLSVKVNNDDIEYTRTDAFIEKAIKYIANHFLAPGMDDEIEDFKNYMKGE